VTLWIEGFETLTLSPALRRAGARRADPVDRHNQRLQPRERHHEAARRLEVLL